LDATPFLESIGEALPDTVCGEAIRVANVLDIAPKPASRTQPLSNTTKNPSKRRDLEWKRLEFEALFIVRF
jgi:hypothetical protein